MVVALRKCASDILFETPKHQTRHYGSICNSNKYQGSICNSKTATKVIYVTYLHNPILSYDL
jgi:hypothetical protein